MIAYAAKRLVLMMIVLGMAMSSAAAAPVPPDVLVRQTIEEVLKIIRSDDRVQSGDVVRIAEVMEQKIAPHFDFPRMTRLAVGRPWRQATPEQRTALIREFRTLLIRSYASAFKMYNAIYVEYRPLRASSDATDAIVSTLIRLPGGAQPVEVDYAMALTDDGWKVFDVRMGGASLIINYRNIFSQEIQRGGVQGLLDALIQKNAGDLSAAAKSQ
ncbi:MAG: ABC transporter substrate-binding protein [Betaproteobacteria bacterium]|nr:MAG: ABC transporter substrate-binding protein [Betaproteobacteria bacterium]